MQGIEKEKRKAAVGVAFSGGGLQGLAHIGAVRALYELGIRPQFVAGSSSGASIAALTAMGCTPDEMLRFARKYRKSVAEFHTGTAMRQLAAMKLKNNGKDGLRDSGIISEIFQKIMAEKGIRGFRDLPINLSVCAADTRTTDECIFTTNEEYLQNKHIHYITGAPLELAVRAAMSFPGLFTSCDYKQFNLIDGGAKDNLPVRILRDMGVGKVIALGFDISGYKPATGLSGMLGVVWRALDLYSVDSTRASMKLADCCVQIKNSSAAIFSMNDLDLTVREGYDAVMKAKDRLAGIINA